MVFLPSHNDYNINVPSHLQKSSLSTQYLSYLSISVKNWKTINGAQ